MEPHYGSALLIKEGLVAVAKAIERLAAAVRGSQ